MNLRAKNAYTSGLLLIQRNAEKTLVASGKYLFTSEAVSMGHPDKLADQISDGVLDALFAQDPNSRVACETMVTTGVVVIAGEITTEATVDMQSTNYVAIIGVSSTGDNKMI